jgi:uncharacterized membrane protein/mono/diheme cytochrome c family protein
MRPRFSTLLSSLIALMIPLLAQSLSAETTATAPTAIAASLKSSKGADSEDSALATAAVFELFEAKCNDCHGAHLERPKGKFGYTMDLKRVAANEDYVVPGDPSKSELFRLVNEDEMPGKDSKEGPATAAEKLALHRWILAGAPSALPPKLAERQAELLSSKKGVETHTKPAQSVLAKALAWVGRFHAATTHFPIALLIVALLSEVMGWATKKESWLACTRFLILLGAASAVNTAILGWLNVYSGVSEVYKLHKWLGTATALWAVICAGNSVFFECREGTPERARLRGALFFGALLVSVVGFLGGAITYGLDHYQW